MHMSAGLYAWLYTYNPWVCQAYHSICTMSVELQPIAQHNIQNTRHHIFWLLGMNLSKYMHHVCWLTVLSLTQYIQNECCVKAMSLAQYMWYQCWAIGMIIPQDVSHECWYIGMSLPQHIHNESLVTDVHHENACAMSAGVQKWHFLCTCSDASMSFLQVCNLLGYKTEPTRIHSLWIWSYKHKAQICVWSIKASF